MEIQFSRFRARTDANGNPILLMDQNRALWDRLLIRRGLAALERADRAADSLQRTPGSYLLQAAIAACHAQARSVDETDWAQIVALYEVLVSVTPSPIIELNRAVAVAMAEGPAAGLALTDAIQDEPSLKNYHLLPSVRGDFLFRLGRYGEARAEFERAASLTKNAREQAVLTARAAACAAPS